MNETNIEKNIQNNVLEKIRGGNVHIRSRMYFVVRLITTIVVAILALLVSTFVVSFVLFSVHESGEQFLLGFGTQGIFTFLSLFPWFSLVADITILVFLEWLLRGFKFGYRISLLTVFLSVFACSTVLGIVVAATPLHMTLLEAADKGTLPVIGEMYESIRDSHADKGVFRGTITSMQGNDIVITHNDNDHDDDDGTRTVILPSDAPPLQIGDRVYVFGTSQSGVIQARGVEKLSSEQ